MATAAADHNHASSDPNLRKAAILLSMLGEDEATAICRRVDPLTAHRLIRVLSALREMDRKEKLVLARELVARLNVGSTGTGMLAAKLRESVLGLRGGLSGLTGEEAELSLLAFEQLSLLDRADPNLIWRAIGGEMPQTIALIAKHLSPANVAGLLTVMPDDMRGDVATRMASPRAPTPGALKALARVCDRLVRIAASGGNSSDGYSQFAADVISHLNRNVAQEVLSAIREHSEETATAIEQKMFKFSDILRLPPSSLQAVLRNGTMSDLALALKGVPESMRSAVFENLSQRARLVLEEEISLLGAVPASEAERAQRDIIALARSLEAAGEITLQPGDVEYVE